MKFPINGPVLNKKEIEAVIDVLKSGNLTSASYEGGKFVREFEKSVAYFVKSKYAVAVNSGTAALQASLYALDIKPGDEILVPSFTFVATVNSIVSLGAKPIFVDILKENYTIDPEDTQKKITNKTKAIIPVHLFGNVSFIERISEVAQKFNLKVIEDSAQSLGSTFKRKHTGTFFELGSFSMYPGKVMTSGEGGFVVTNSKKLQEKLLMIRNHGMVKGNDTRILGLNFRLPEVSAAIAKIQMKKLGNFLKTRQKNANLLSKLISDLDIILPNQRKHEKVNWYLFTIGTLKRNKILKGLNSKGIGAVSYYSQPVHRMPFYKQKIKLPVTDWASSHVLSLPINPSILPKDIKFIGKSLRELLNG